MKYQNNLEQIVKKLNLKVSENTLKTAFKFHPDYPSLSALSDILSEWQVDNLAVKISPQQLSELTFPAIAHLEHEHEDYFILLENFENQQVTYWDSEKGTINESIELFTTKWQGVKFTFLNIFYLIKLTNMKLLNLSVLIILLLLKNTTFGQTKNIKIYFNDKANTTLITFFDELLDYKRSVIGLGRSNVYEFNSSYPTVVHLSKFAKSSPFLVFPGDNLVFERGNDSTYYRCINRPDSLFHLLAKFEYTVGSEIAAHSNFQINDSNKSDFESLRLSVLEKLNKHLLELSQTRGDSLFSEAIKSELVNFSFLEFLQPLIANSNKNIIVPQQYVDSLISFKSKFIKNDTIVLGVEHRKAIIAYNEFLCRDSLLLSKNRFQVLCNSAVKNFKGQQLYFLYAYLLKSFKVFNPENFYDNVGVFYELCKDEYFLKYVKDKLDDRGFEYPKFVLEQEFITDEATKVTWQDILKKNKGKLMYIDIWASWCRPCLEEMSSLKKIANDYKNKNISFISFSIDDKKKTWQSTSKKHNINVLNKENYWIKKHKKFIQFMINRREDEFTPVWIPKCLLIDTNGNIITSKAIRPSHKELYNQLDLFLEN